MIKAIFNSYKVAFIFTILLIVFDAIAMLLFPLFMGYAINGAIESQFGGAIKLGILGLIAILVGATRRFFDSRFYAKVFRKYGEKISNLKVGHDASKKAARLNMLRELIEFMENSFPALVASLIGFVGVLLIIFGLNHFVFLASILCAVLIVIIYAMSSNRTIRLNKSYNDEVEQQVNIIADANPRAVNNHLFNITKWNIKLSDLEMSNYSISWLFLMALLLFSIVIAGKETITYGALFALIMYVFDFMQSVISLPLFYQQWLRLKEINGRLNEVLE